MKLTHLPLRDIKLIQPFGANYVDFYAKLGLKGHNGLDFRARNGCPVYATHTGYVTFAGRDGTGGIGVEIQRKKEGKGFKTMSYHLKSVIVKKGDRVEGGQTIGYADNTGKYTTGDHLHFQIKPTYDGMTVNYNNGYRGAIDPAPLLPDGWDKLPAEKRYGRKRTWAIYKRYEIPVMITLIKYLGRLPKHEEINACVYGGWDKEAIKNPAMYYNWAYLKKSQFLSGKIPFTK